MRKIALLFLLLFSATALAQTTPTRDQTRDAVLRAMSQRMGTSLTENSFSNRFWYYGNYDYVRTASSGCIGAPSSAPTVSSWQRFEYTYRGVVFAYLVSENLQSVILCNESAMPSAQATAIATIAPSATPLSSVPINVSPTATFQALATTGASQRACTLAPRLSVNGTGQVTPGDANWLHSSPARASQKTGEIPAGEQFEILAEAVCDTQTGLLYWRVRYNGLVGWTAEGSNGEYWLEPVAVAVATFTSTPLALSAASFANVTAPEWLRLHAAVGELRIAMSPTANLAAIADPTGNIWLWDTVTNQNLFSRGMRVAITALAFSETGDYLLIGTEDGRVDIIQIGDGVFTVTASMTLTQRISALMATDGLVFVVDASPQLTVWEISNPAQAVFTASLTQPANSLEFNAQNKLLIVNDAAGYMVYTLQLPR